MPFPSLKIFIESLVFATIVSLCDGYLLQHEFHGLKFFVWHWFMLSVEFIPLKKNCLKRQNATQKMVIIPFPYLLIVLPNIKIVAEHSLLGFI